MIFTNGIAVGALSGSVGGTTASHNRYGAYFRTRAIPTKATSTDATNAKARFGNQSQGWQARTAAERLQWNNWAQTNPIVNALGQPHVLSGNAAYVQLNTILDQAGESTLTAPPISAAPDSLDTLVLAADIGLGNVDLTFTPTPLGATERLVIQAAVVDSQAINYVANLYRIILFSPAASASPVDIENELNAKFGTLIVGQEVHVRASVIDNATGLRSLPLQDRATVVST